MINKKKETPLFLVELSDLGGFPDKIPEFFRLILDNLPDLVWAKNIDDEYLFANKAIRERLLKCDDPDEVVGKTDTYFALKERAAGNEYTFGEICVNSDEIVKLSGQPERFIEDGMVREEYLIIDVHKAPFFDETGKVIGTVGCGRDITQEKDIGDKLFRSRQQFICVLNNLTSLVYVVDLKTYEILFVNQTMADQYGKKTSEFLGRKCWEILHGGRAEPCEKCYGRDMIHRLGEDSETNVREVEDVFLNRIYEVSEQVIKWSDDRLVKLAILTDITDRKRIEEERAQAQRFALEQEKYALIGQVAGKMAHDFNNILGGIMGNAELSLLDCGDEQIERSLNVILDQAIRGRSMTQNLVAFAKDQEPKEEFFDINSKIDLVINLLQQDIGSMKITKDYTAVLPELLADPGMIEHVLVNLIQNSIHATSLQASPELTVKTYADSGKMFIEIIDNGCGIPEEYHKDIYCPSFTLKGSKDIQKVYKSGIKGTGYGMSNVKKYVEKHKGHISFDSNLGKGTRFIVSIPIIKKGLSKSDKRIISRQEIAANKRILLVEDEPAIAEVQTRILSGEPFCHSVTLAHDGPAAIKAYEKGCFDLISLDYLLPGDMNGLEVYKYIRVKNKTVPIVFVSGNIAFLESMMELTKTDKLMEHISKPCENIIYADTINKLLCSG